MPNYVIEGELGGNIRYGDAYTWTPNLWSYLISRFSIRSMLDVGCGEGHAVSYFLRNGCIAHGIDGSIKNIARSVVPIALHNLVDGKYIMPVDLVWSCEVAEHIPESSVNNYIGTLANGTIVAMTHAVPGQAGHNHVNCQLDDYWIDKMRNAGYDLFEENNWIRKMSIENHTDWNHFSQSGLLFYRK